jgi:two-component system, chemotaxis family, CheB/CheR fusion protein
VFSNVLTNAAKYTDANGRIEIRVTALEHTLEVTISDNGAGISAEFMPRLFDMFAQADKTSERSQGGLGIGLQVVKKLVGMHGGEVTARSDGLGHGSTFVISLPRALPSLAALRAAS